MEKEDAVKKALERLGLPDKVETRELASAYGDVIERNYGIEGIGRKLRWKSSVPLSGLELNLYMGKIIPYYNLFEGDIHPQMLSEMFPEEDFYPAREDSVCIYIEGQSEDFWDVDSLDDLCGDLDAQECEIHNDSLRIYWD